MSAEPTSVLDPAYWRHQLKRAGANLHLAVWCSPRRWLRHHDRRHRLVLEKFVGPRQSVLDAGCAYGRLLGVMPESWAGDYLGVDLCPEFVDLARRRHPGREFLVADLRDLGAVRRRYDWAVLVSVKHTVIGNAGLEVWAQAEAELRRVAGRLLFLEWAVDEEPDYGFPRVCHHDYERTVTPDRMDAEDWG